MDKEGKRRSRAFGLPIEVVDAALDEMRRAVKTEAQRLLKIGIEPHLVRGAVVRGFRDAMAKMRRPGNRPVAHEKHARSSKLGS